MGNLVMATRAGGWMTSQSEWIDLWRNALNPTRKVKQTEAMMADWQVHQRVAAKRTRQIGQPGGWQYAKITAVEGETVTVKFERDGDVQTVPATDIKLRNE